ncbi:hypothetical protein [Bartonella sp. B1098]|uniref:hypothetical protein n=1 Tax=Bartonella sp. B1098 TaxID=2911421 RepID=UPI0020C51112|nr:hypothetical protein [Bartonella sp. B1098]
MILWVLGFYFVVLAIQFRGEIHSAMVLANGLCGLFYRFLVGSSLPNLLLCQWAWLLLRPSKAAALLSVCLCGKGCSCRGAVGQGVCVKEKGRWLAGVA